jgi:hypothetical protein
MVFQNFPLSFSSFFLKKVLPRLAVLGLIFLFPLQAARAADSLWEALPLITQSGLDAGNSGGEGCQVIQNFAIDSTGNFLMMATNVGGLYRSLDGGAHWEPADVGYAPRGAAALAIDPNNPNRVLAVGGNSGRSPVNGLWLSTDKAASWKPVLRQNTRAAETYHDSVAFDASSKRGSGKAAFSARAYWLAYSDAGGGLWKSIDGGNSWAEVQASFADGIVKVNPLSGAVYLATAKGFFRGGQKGTAFTQTVTGPVLGLDVIATRPNNVYILKNDGVYVSTDSGQTFTPAGSEGLPTADSPGLKNLKVSPVDPGQMLLNDDQGSYYKQGHYYSADGGKTWASCKLDSSPSFIPTNDRPWLFIWSPVRAGRAWACGGGYVTQSPDGGAHFAWSNNGFNGFTCAGLFNFNPHDPGLLLVTSQDTNSAFTAGITGRPVPWRYLEVSGKDWGGFNYGGYALNPEVMFAGNAGDWDAPATLMVSTNGGGRWRSTGDVGNGTQTSCGDPGNAAVAFWDNYRTADGGDSWQAMAGCDGVFTYNPSGGRELYGAKAGTVVVSTDQGATWKALAWVPGTVLDLAFDGKRHRLYIATGSLYQFDIPRGALTDLSPRLGMDNGGNRKAVSVAVDPQDTDVVYAAWHGDRYISDESVRRSLDGGRTWKSLNLRPGDKGPDGGLESECVRVHPVTRYLYSGGSCFGLWRYPPPASREGRGPGK